MDVLVSSIDQGSAKTRNRILFKPKLREIPQLRSQARAEISPNSPSVTPYHPLMKTEEPASQSNQTMQHNQFKHQKKIYLILMQYKPQQASAYSMPHGHQTAETRHRSCSTSTSPTS